MASRHPPRRAGPRALLSASRWDELPLLGVGQTGQVLRAGSLVVKVAHPGPEARARLLEEVRSSRLLRERRVRVPRVVAFQPSGRALVRRFVDGAPLTERLSTEQEHQLFALAARLEPIEEALGHRFDLSPANLRWHRGALWLLDAGRRVAPPALRFGSPEALRRSWRAWFHRPRAVRLEPVTFLPSGRFHVEVPVGRDPKARLLWSNERLARELGVRWSQGQLEQLGALTTLARARDEVAIATRYVDMIALDRAKGPKGDGRALLLGTLAGREVSLKGGGPTPLAWKGRAFHEDGLVSFPRALWEVTVADELARLGFDVPQYLALFGTGHRTLDNTGRRWPAAAGLRVVSTHLRLGHLRAVSHRPDRFRAMLDFAGRQLLGERFDSRRAGDVAAFVRQFAANLGHDIGRTDALQIHGFNPTPGNVRLDGHLIDFSTVRFHRQYLPDWRFLENRYPVRIHRLVWRRLVSMLVRTLGEGRIDFSEARALRWFDRAFAEGFYSGLVPIFGLRPGHRLRRRFVALTERLRALRRSSVVEFAFWKQTVPAPRFELLGKAPEVMTALERGHRAPWKVLQAVDEPLPPREEALALRWSSALKVVRQPGAVVRCWAQVVRPFVEPEALAALLYGQSTPGSFAPWQRLISTSRHLPEGVHGHRRAKAFAEQLGHVVLPGLDGTFEERVVGLTPELLDGVRRALRSVLGRRLLGCVAHGSRVIDRVALAHVAPEQLAGNDLTPRGRVGVREFGPVAASSDLDLKVFVRPGLSSARLERLELRLGEALAALGAWFPFATRRPPRQRLIVSGARNLVTAFTRWNGRRRRAELGKGPIPLRQTVVIASSNR